MVGAAWDLELALADGHLLQSWRWGEFKQRQNWAVERLSGRQPYGSWMAQILFRSSGPLTLAYIPCGPTMSGDHEQVFPQMCGEIDRMCRQHRAVTLILEPNQRFNVGGSLKEHGFVRWTRPFQPRKTLAIPIADNESMLQNMHSKTRYHIRLAARRGMEAKCLAVTEAALLDFHRLLAETAERNQIRLLPLRYFTELMDALENSGALLFVYADGRPVAAALMALFDDTASYLFAGSSTKGRGQGAGAYLVFSAVQWARERGSRELDLGSVEPAGLRIFKSGFGGHISVHPNPMERRYQSVFAWGVRRVLGARGL